MCLQNKIYWLLLTTALSINSLFAQKLSYEQKLHYLQSGEQSKVHFDNQKHPGDLSKPQTKEPVTVTMLNCPEGVYRTYEDFVNKKVETYTYVSVHVKGGSFKGLKGFEVEFKDGSGKKEMIDCDAFWGWKDQKGRLWRNGVYSNATTFSIPFYVEYVSDYIEYHPSMDANCEFKPFEWCSGDLKSPILESDYFIGHNKTRHNSVSTFQTNCDSKAPRAAGAWAESCGECETKSPDLVAVFVWGKGNVGTYKPGGLKVAESPEK